MCGSTCLFFPFDRFVATREVLDRLSVGGGVSLVLFGTVLRPHHNARGGGT
ncbi:hypothetical protein HanIR_Chr14g0695701 [Helianthus annuus]|nr:hypothetical protein HanIR_Chr14g0695701 [Helianthus annuus]